MLFLSNHNNYDDSWVSFTVLEIHSAHSREVNVPPCTGSSLGLTDAYSPVRRKADKERALRTGVGIPRGSATVFLRYS